MTEDNGKDPVSQTRRRLFKSIGVIPVSAVALSQAPAAMAEPVPQRAAPAAPYTRTFFTEQEWTFLGAACDRLIPADEHGPGAIEAGVLEFMDRHMQTPYANGAIWYMQGPYLDAKPQFGYQGRQTLKEIIRTGIAAVDAHCKASFAGKSFKDLPHDQQEALLRDAESGKLELKDASSRLFFRNLLAEVRNGYFCDPVHGGNKGMAAWKMIGYPGMRGDYLDWVEVRDKAYPLPAVDLAGTRG